MIITNLNKATNFFDRALYNFDKIKRWKIFGATVLSAIIYNVIFSLLLNNFFQIELKTTGLEDLSLPEKFLVVVIVGPIFKTIIFQCLIIEFFGAFLPRYKGIGLVLSASLFAFSHAYSNAYIVFAFIPGLLFGALYLIFKNRDKHPFILVFLAHALINLYSLIHNTIF